MAGLMDAVLAFLQSLQGAPAYGLVFGLLLASGFGLPINEDILLLAAAALTLRGVMDPVLLAAVAWCGVLCADTLIFHWGHRFGAPLLRHPKAARALPPGRLAAMQARLQRWGPACLFAVRFAPGLRSPLLFAAGAMKLRYAHLLLFDGAAAALEMPLLVWAVRGIGGNWRAILDAVQRWQAVLLPLLLALGAAALVLWRRRRGRKP